MRATDEMTDSNAMREINKIMKDTMMALDFNGGKNNYYPIHNTTRKKCYEALFKIQNICIQNGIWWLNENKENIVIATRKINEIAETVDKHFNDDIQHVGYDDEQLGREK